MRLLVCITFTLVASCLSGNYKYEELLSPTGKYTVYATVDRTDKSAADYADVVIHLMDNQKQLIQSVNSHVVDFNKWTLEWKENNDTLILKNSDLGDKIYFIEENNLKELE